MATASPALGFRDVLLTPAIRRLWIAQIVSVFGDFLAIFAIFSVVTFELHATPMQVAMVMVAFLTPLAVISPVAGVFVDKWNVRWTMIASDLIRALMVVVLVFVHDLNVIYATIFSMSLVSAFFVPAQSVAIRSLAPAGGLLAVNALMTQAVQGAQILTPSITGLLVDSIGASTCFILDIASFFVSAALVFSIAIHRKEPAGAQSQAPSGVLKSMNAGLHFIFTHAAISYVLISMAFGMFAVRCFGSLLSVWVRDVLHSNATLFGYLNTLIGIGMIVGSQMVPKLARRFRPEHLVSYALASMGVWVAVTAAFARLLPTAAGMLGLGFGAAFIMITSQTLLQHETPSEMLGRVSSTMMSIMAVAQVLSMLFAGPVADMVGLRNLYYGSAVMLVAVGAIGLRQLGQHKVG